jgi:uncharacterized coiled-coil DUF342 family protein
MNTFDSKLKEVFRNLKMIETFIKTPLQSLAMLRGFSQDLIYMVQELDLTPHELVEVRKKIRDLNQDFELIESHLRQAFEHTEKVCDHLNDVNKFAPFMGRKIVNPFKPLFSGKLAHKSPIQDLLDILEEE